MYEFMIYISVLVAKRNIFVVFFQFVWGGLCFFLGGGVFLWRGGGFGLGFGRLRVMWGLRAPEQPNPLFCFFVFFVGGGGFCFVLVVVVVVGVATDPPDRQPKKERKKETKIMFFQGFWAFMGRGLAKENPPKNPMILLCCSYIPLISSSFSLYEQRHF